MDSILLTIRRMLGVEDEYDGFDAELIVHINTAFMSLMQLGVGSSTGFSITDETDVWDDFLSTATDLHAVKTYIYMKVRMVWDPPTVGGVLDSFNRQISELEWRLTLQVDPPAV